MKEQFELVIKSKVLIIVAIILAVLLVIGIVVAIPMAIIHAPRVGVVSSKVFDPNKEFVMENEVTYTFEKEKGEDFKILNLTDTQISTWGDTIFNRNELKKNIEILVNTTKPDLITVTGDLFWLDGTYLSCKQFIKMMDSFKTPWAPVFGNHDQEGNIDKNWAADRFLESEYCIFDKGPMNIGGVGNYFINIKEEGKIVHTMMFLDSGTSLAFPEITDENKDSFVFDKYEVDKKTGKPLVVGANYDFISYEQIAWYKWVMEGIAKAEGKAIGEIESSAYFHIALPEFEYAASEWEHYGKPANFEIVKYNHNGESEVLIGEENTATKAFGSNSERVCSSKYNSGFFDVLKAYGTKDVVVGHDHVNSASIMFEGVRLTYGLKTGDRCYAETGMMGGTTLTLGADNHLVTVHVYQE